MARGSTFNETELAKLRSREKVEEELLRDAMKQVMALPAGRRVMYDLIFEKCRVMDVYAGQDSGIYRHEGRRSLGTEIILDLQANHTEQYILMVSDRMRERKLDQSYRDAVTTKDSQET